MRSPNILPIFTPTPEKRNAVQSISKTAIATFTFNAANVIPTANASMLVAMAAGIITFAAIDAEFDVDVSFIVSLSIFKPIRVNRMKDRIREIGAMY